MKKNKITAFGTVILMATLAFTSCKKQGDPGPAGANGSDLRYKQVGTTLQLTGTYSSNQTSFDKTFNLPYFSTLEQNAVTEAPIVLRKGNERTEIIANPVNSTFYITRLDSINNSILSFELQYTNDGNSTPQLNSFYFKVVNVTSPTAYKKIYTVYGGGGFRTTDLSDNDGTLSGYDLSNDGNSFTINNWSYDIDTKNLSFDYSGLLTSTYNSTGSDLNFSGKVKANLKSQSLRVAQ